MEMGAPMSGRVAKRRRDQREKAAPIVLEPRDVDVLALVGLCRYCGADQIERDLFPSADRCRRRLRALFDNGYLSFTLVDSRSPNLVGLTRKGVDALRIHLPDVAERVRPAGTIEAAGVAHHRAIVDARLYSVALGRRRGAPLIEWSNAGGELGVRLGLDRFHLEPDGIAGFSAPSGTAYVAVEVDRATQRVRTTIAEKISRYREVAAGGLVDALWFVTSAGLGRVQNIEAALIAAGLAEWSRVLTLEHLTARPVLELPRRGGAGRDTASGRNIGAHGVVTP